MDQASSTKKPKPKASIYDEQWERIDKLERCIEKMATLTGNGNHLNEFGLKRWEPGNQDMRKFN